MYVLKLFFVLIFIFNYSYSLQLDYIKFQSLDKNNAELGVEKKKKHYEYILKYKLGKYGYEEDEEFDNSFFNQDNEDRHNLIFSNNFYIDDSLWLDLNIDYQNSSTRNMNNYGGLVSENIVKSQQSLVKLYFKPNSIITTNLSFENIDKDSLNDINDDGYEKTTFKDENKLSFDINLDFDSIDIYTKFYLINNNLNKWYKGTDSEYEKNTTNQYRGVELTFSKELFKTFLINTTLFREIRDYDYRYTKTSSRENKEINQVSQGIKVSIEKDLTENLNLLTSIRVSDDKIINSNQKNLIGKTPKYKAKNQLDVKLEQKIDNIKLFGKISYMSNSYANEENTKKLNSYKVGTIGTSFNTKIYKQDASIDFDIKRIFNKEYFEYTDTEGDAWRYFVKIIISF